MVISLCGSWKTATDPGNTGREEKWFARGAAADARDTRVPSVIQETFPGYHGVAWYWRSFTAPERQPPGGRFLLRFWAVGYMADVWMNGVRVGGHEGGETPFTLDATGAVTPGENQLVVRVLNPTSVPIDGITLKQTPHRNKVDPPSPGSDLNHGGIFQPVELILAPAARIRDVHARPDWSTGRIRLAVALRNENPARTPATLEVHVAPASGGETIAGATKVLAVHPGDSTSTLELDVDGHRLWSLEDPFLYRVTVALRPEGAAGATGVTEAKDETTIRVGFRDFRVVRGYFRLNGKRVFLKSTHTGNCSPVGQVLPPEGMPDILRRDLLYAKASGYNTVRFIAMAAHPWELDMCDELGLLVYEESYAAWLLEDSPDMERRFDFSVSEIVLRDRNHPSLVVWGLLNETRDGPVFRHAVQALGLVRRLDDTRLVLLSSGRWDGKWSIGSVSNPGTVAWEHAWGKEAPGAPDVPAQWDPAGPAYLPGAGDAHVYPRFPHPPESERLIRTLGNDSKPAFLSEYGIGSMMNVVNEVRNFEQHGARNDAEDYLMLKDMAVRLEADMRQWGMMDVFPFPEELLVESQARTARHRIQGFDLVRSNPSLCGFNLTGMLDHALAGEGLWTLWRAWKPGAMDALQNGWAPVRWCLFVEPSHAYVGRPLRIEAALANEDALPPGGYPVTFRLFGPNGVAWERRVEAVLPSAAPGGDPPLAVKVLEETIAPGGPPGVYRLVADMERGGAPMNRSHELTLSDPADLPAMTGTTVSLVGVDAAAEAWLKGRGVACRKLDGKLGAKPDGNPGSSRSTSREVILVGNLSPAAHGRETWVDLAERVATGSVAVFLSCEAFRREKDANDREVDLGWLPLVKKGRCRLFNDWLYHKENVARRHPVFEGLQGNGILDVYYYGSLFPRHIFDGQDDPEEVVAAGFAAGYCGGGSKGYESGTLMSVHKLGSGRILLNTFPVLETLDVAPAADRMLLNMIRYAASLCGQPPTALPAGFPSTLRALGYTP